MRTAARLTRDDHTCKYSMIVPPPFLPSHLPSISFMIHNNLNSVTNVRDDLSTLTTFLTALEVPWGQIGGTFDLDFGKAVLPTKPVSRRILGRMERGIDSAVKISAGEPGNKINILPGGRS